MNRELSEENSGRRRLVNRIPHYAIGYILAAAGLIWVLRDFRMAELRNLVANLDWRWIVPAIFCDVMSYVSQGARWRLLLKPIGKLTTLRATQAIYAGMFTNEILPMRPGEFMRAYLAARWTESKFIAVIPSLLVERLFDGLWVVAGVGLTAMYVPLPRYLIRATYILGAVVILAACVLIYFVFRPPKATRYSSGPLHIVWSLHEKLADFLQGIALRREFYLSLAISLVLLIFQALAFWLVMRGAGLQLSFWVGAAVYLIVHLGTAIPNAPANVGSYQFFTVAGLTLFGVEKSAAAGFSLVVFALLTLPLLVLGFAALSTSGINMLKIRRQAQDLAGVAR